MASYSLLPHSAILSNLGFFAFTLVRANWIQASTVKYMQFLFLRLSASASGTSLLRCSSFFHLLSLAPILFPRFITFPPLLKLVCSSPHLCFGQRRRTCVPAAVVAACCLCCCCCFWPLCCPCFPFWAGPQRCSSAELLQLWWAWVFLRLRREE